MYRRRFILVVLLCYIFFISIIACKTDKNEQSNLQSVIADNSLRKLIDEVYELPEDIISQNKAIRILKECRSDSIYLLASDSLKAHCIFRIACHYYFASNYDTAKVYLDTVINFQEQVSFRHHEKTLAKSYFTRSLMHQEKNEFDLALSDITAANRILQKLEGVEDVKGQYFAKTAHYFSAMNQFERAREFFDIAEATISENTMNRADLLNDIGNFFSRQKNYKKALTYYDEAVRIYKSIDAHYSYLIPVQVNLADVNAEIKPYKEAIKGYKVFVEALIDSTVDIKRHKRIAYSNLAYLNWENKDLENAERNYQNALQLAEEITSGQHSVYLAKAYEGLGDVEYGKKQYNGAILNYHKAIQALAIGFDSKDLLKLPNIQEHVIINRNHLERIIGLKAKTFFKKYQKTQNISELQSAFKTYKILDELLTQIRQGYKEALSRYELIEKTIPHYEQATQVALELYERTKELNYLEQAYSFASKNKAIVMLDGLQNEKALFAGVPADILKQEENLKKEIYAIENEIFLLNQSELADSSTFNTMLSNRINLILSYESLIDQLELNYPKYFDLKYKTKESVSISDLQNQLASSTIVIEYFFGKENIYVFSFKSSNPLLYHLIPITDDLTVNCIRYRQLIEKDSFYTLSDYSKVANGLYKDLLEEIFSKVVVNDNDHLIIIPDDILLQFSFESLLTEPVDASKVTQWTDPLPYLIRKYSVSYAYSRDLIFSHNDQERIFDSNGGYIGFGIEYDEYTLDALNELLRDNGVFEDSTRGVGKLMYSDDEVIESADILGGHYFINDEATKAKFYSEFKKASILHLVTHGYVINGEPLNSGLVFTKMKDDEDFILRTRDLYAIDLSSYMAVLSACYTGDGKIMKGEGIRSVARAFNYAGCPNVTASLWAAPDLSTKEIILDFYRNLLNSHSINQSLRLAKIQYLDECIFEVEALPSRWAHLITIGDYKSLY